MLSQRSVHVLKEILLSLLAGLIVGIVFKMIKLPLPAPPVLSGVLGIVGVFLGGLAYEWISQSLRSVGK
ncbi:XapX domain protein [Cohnella sp. CIP 111063]|nr:XapX domain protein [Cohnella sp. CIP 111063]